MLEIIQYNCGGANGGKARPFLDSIRGSEIPMLVIQEPGTGGEKQQAYCPRGYRWSRKIEPGMKVATMVYDKIPSPTAFQET
jgi:hypothetical protein